jgi:tetratricopeptide (TPR) repeat protein
MADPKDLALVPVRPMIARDLRSAGKGQLVYVGRDGEVKDPSGVKSRQLAAYVAFGGITIAGVALAAASFPVLIPFYAALGSRFVGTVRAVQRVNQASVALSNGDAATGRALAEPVSRAWWVPRRVRALAELRVAIADALDGHSEQALLRVVRARAKLSPRLIQYQFSYYTEINLLIALGRLKEARAVLEARGGVPSGAVLRLSYWIAEMHLCVAEGKLTLDDAELHHRMREALDMTSGRDLLLLCAWAYAQRGEHDDALFAWRQAMEREGSQRLDVAMPKLAAWMDSYKQSHPAVEQPEEL